MADVLYLFDGWNILHAGDFADPQELVDRLADFVAVRGARGVVVFDGEGPDASYGRLEVRYARPADPLLERLAVQNRASSEVVLVSTDRAVRDTAGLDVRKVHSAELVPDLGGARPGGRTPGGKVEDAVDETVRERLEEWRRRRA